MSGGYGSAHWGLFGLGGADDDFPPHIGGWGPFFGAVIGRLGTIEFEVTDDFGVVDTRVQAVYPAGVIELVYTQSVGFWELYKRGCGRAAIEGGHRYVLRRTGGWPSANVRIDVTTTDLAGNVTTGQALFL
jgi:hypothetical protein